MRLPERAVAILQQVLAGLGHAHAQGVVHRDLKPENVLVHESALGNGELPPGSVKIADFGLGRGQTQAGGSIVMSMDVMASTQNRAVGTLAYMAPGVQSGQPAGPQADLYACGVMLFELLTGDRPGFGDLPSHVAPNVPEYLDTVYRRACSRLELRFTSVKEMAESLKPPRPVRAPPKRSEVHLASQSPSSAQVHGSTWAFDAVTARRRQEDFAARMRTPIELTNSVKMKFALIPPGEFVMGSPDSEVGRSADETQHRVKLTRGFYIGVTPVTQGQWQTVMGGNPSHFRGWFERFFPTVRRGLKVDLDLASQLRPVESVLWGDSVSFCERLTERERLLGRIGAQQRYRLPTEAESEYACRAGAGGLFGGTGRLEEMA